MKILSETCVNSKWKASFLVKKGEEFCQCFGECKVRVRANSGYVFILTQSEIKRLEAFEAYA